LYFSIVFVLERHQNFQDCSESIGEHRTVFTFLKLAPRFGVVGGSFFNIQSQKNIKNAAHNVKI